jgi:tetratricopeptide (TPR) repeat protein
MEEIVQQALSKGVEMHVAGEFELASQLYGSVIKLDPNHADANHNMGLLKIDTGDALEALPYLQTALQADTSVAQFWRSYIKALIQLDRMDEASKVLSLAQESGAEGEEFLELHQQLNEPTVEVEPVQSEADTSSQSKQNILDTLNLDKALRLAKTKVEEGSPEEAKRIYQDILEKFPKNKQAQQGLAVLNKPKQSAVTQGPPQDIINQLINLYNQGQLAAVVEQAQDLTQQYPDASVVWNILGAANKGLGRVGEASKAFTRVIKLNPTYADGYNNLGVTLREQGKLDEAIASYKKALSLKPDYAEAYNNMGIVFREQGKLKEAIGAYSEALSIKPDQAEIYNNMGTLLKKKGKPKEAIEAYNKALSLKPDYVEAHNNLGNALHEQGQLEEAIEAYNKSLSLKPDYAGTYTNKGVVLQDQGKLEEAIEAYNRALSLKTDCVTAHENLSFALLNDGKITEGLAENEWRWKTTEGLKKNRNFSQPMWNGERYLNEKTILLWSEQGPGDIVIWLSALKYFIPLVKKCIIECPKKLVRLLERSFPEVQVRTEGRNIRSRTDEFDLHLPLGSLFKHFIPEITSRSTVDAFLLPDLERVKYWKEKLNALGNGPFIGISWKSPLMTAKRMPNYTIISEWEPLLLIQGVTFINLQSNHFKKDLIKIEEDLGVKVHNFDEIDQYNDLDEVAALCAALDVCVSIATAASCIAAAVGTRTIIPTWKQSSWNNILFNATGPKVEMHFRNSWEDWEDIFANISRNIMKL